MSAVDSANNGANPTIQVLITMHQGMDTLDFVGPLEVLHAAQHDIKDTCTYADDLSRVVSVLTIYA